MNVHAYEGVLVPKLINGSLPINGNPIWCSFVDAFDRSGIVLCMNSGWCWFGFGFSRLLTVCDYSRVF